MKLEFLSFDFDKFAQEMQNLKDKKGFDYLVTKETVKPENPVSAVSISLRIRRLTSVAL